ncbi:uncharacterized protein [Asterias amurensis]|uniref:uncharacterized protein n=1 Tax=Asterias amurensis TaxID=7602 RepID=UPI003AB1CB8C
MKRQKKQDDVSKDSKRAKVQVNHNMCIKKRRVAKVQQNVIKNISATFCQTMEDQESCAIVKRKRVAISLGPDKNYVPHVGWSKRRTATCDQARTTSRKAAKQAIIALDKHVQESDSSAGKTSLETSPSANRETMRLPINLTSNKSVLKKIQGTRGGVSPSSSSTTVRNTRRRFSPASGKRSSAVSTQRSKPNMMLRRLNEKTSSVLRSRRKRTLKVHSETLSKVGASVDSLGDPSLNRLPIRCSPSDAVHVDDKFHNHDSNTLDTSKQETNTSSEVQRSPIKRRLRAKQTSSSSQKASREPSVSDIKEYAEDVGIFSVIKTICHSSGHTKLVDETKTAKQKYGSRRQRVASSEPKSESYRQVWKRTSTHQKQSKLLLSRHYRNQKINVRKAKSVGETTMLLKPNKTVTSGFPEREKTDQHTNVENTCSSHIVVVGPNRRCIPVLSKLNKETKSHHTCPSQPKDSAVGGVNSTTKWMSSINKERDNSANALNKSAVNRKKTISCTEILKTSHQKYPVKSAKSSPALTQMEAQLSFTCNSPQVPTPKCQIVNEKEVQVLSTPERLTVGGNQTKLLIQNEVSVTLNKLCYESVSHILHGDGSSECQASSVPQHSDGKRQYLRDREVAGTRTALKSDSEKDVQTTGNIAINHAGLNKVQSTAIISSTPCQSNINSSSAIKTKPRGKLQKTSLCSEDTTNDTAKGNSSTLSKRRNAKDSSERIQKESRLKLLKTKVSDDREQFTDPEGKRVQMPLILQDQDNLKTACQATLAYSPKIVMGLRPYARYRSNGDLHSYKHWLLVQGQIEEQVHLVSDQPVRLKRKRKRKRRRTKTGLQQKENEENPNQSVPTVQDNVSTETYSQVLLEAPETSTMEHQKLAVRNCKDLQEKTTCQTSGPQKDASNLKDAFCEVDSGANNVEGAKDERLTPSDVSHEASNATQVSREECENTNLIVSQSQSLDDDSVSPEPTCCLSPVSTEQDTQTSDCKVVAEADGTLSLIISSSETPSPDVEVVSQSTLVQVYSAAQSGPGSSPPCIISPHPTESPKSDKDTLSEHESGSLYLTSQRGSLNPENKAGTQTTSGDGSTPQDGSFSDDIKSLEDPNNTFETQDTDVQQGFLNFDEEIDIVEFSDQFEEDDRPIQIVSEFESSSLESDEEIETVDISDQLSEQDAHPIHIECEQDSTIPNCDTGKETVDILDQLVQDGRPIDIVCEQESSILDCDTKIGTVEVSDRSEHGGLRVQIVCEQDSSNPESHTEKETVHISDRLEQDGRPIQTVCEQDSSIPYCDEEKEPVKTSDQLLQDGRPIHIECENESSFSNCDTRKETVDNSDRLEQDGRSVQTVCEQESSNPRCDTGKETVDISEQLEENGRPIPIVFEQESPNPNCDTGKENIDISDQLEQDGRSFHIVSEQDSSSPSCDTDIVDIPAENQIPDNGSATAPVFTEQDTCSNQTHISYQQSSQSIASELVTSQESPESDEQHDSKTRTTSLAMTSHPSASDMNQANIDGTESCSLTQDEVSDTSAKDLLLPLLQSDSNRGSDEVELQPPKSDAEPPKDLQRCDNQVKELHVTYSRSPEEAHSPGQVDSDSVTVSIQPDLSPKHDSENLTTSEKSSRTPTSKAQENIQEEKSKCTTTEDVKKSFNFKQLWNIKRVPKNKGQRIAYFYERVNKEEVDEVRPVILERTQPSCSSPLDSVRSGAASHKDLDNGPEMTTMPQKHQSMYEKETSHREENCIKPKSILLDIAPLMKKANEKETSAEPISVQQVSSLINSAANKKPDLLSTQNEIRNVTESPVICYPSQTDTLSAFVQPNQGTMKPQHSRGCQFEKRTSSLEFETTNDSLQCSSEETSSSEQLPPDVSPDSSSVSFSHATPKDQEFTPMFEGSMPEEDSSTDDRVSAVESDSAMIETPFTTALKGNLSQHGNMTKQTDIVNRVCKTRTGRKPLLASMTLRKKDEHFLFSRLGFKKSKQRKSHMSDQRKYMVIKKELSQIPDEDCVKPEPLFMTGNQHQECRYQSNLIVPEVTYQSYRPINRVFTSTSPHRMVQMPISEFPQTSRRIGKRHLTASKTLSPEDYIFPAKRIKRHQLSSMPLTGSVFTNNQRRSQFGNTVPHRFLIPRRGRPGKVCPQDPATVESSGVSGVMEQTRVLNHQEDNAETLRRCTMNVSVKDKPSLLVLPDTHVDNPGLKLEQNFSDQSLLACEPRQKDYRKQVLNQGYKDSSVDTEMSIPNKRGRPKKKRRLWLYQHGRKHQRKDEEKSGKLQDPAIPKKVGSPKKEKLPWLYQPGSKQLTKDEGKSDPAIPKKVGRPKKNSIIESKERKPFTRSSKVKKGYAIKSNRLWYQRNNTIAKGLKPKVGQTLNSKAGNNVKRVRPKKKGPECGEPTRPKKVGRPRKIPLSEEKEPSTHAKQRQQKGNSLGESGEPALRLKKKMGRPRKIPLNEVKATSTPTDQLQQQIIKGNLLGESGEPAMRPKNKGGRPRKNPASEVKVPSTLAKIPKKKIGRPRKIPLVEVQTPLGGIDQQGQDPTPKRKYCRKNNSPCGIDQQSQEPKPKSKYRFELNFLGGFKRASAGKKPLHKNKGGRPRKIPLSEVQTPSTLSEQPPQQIIKGNLLGESEEPALKPKNKGGRPRKIPLSELIAPSTPSEQPLQQIIKGNLLGESEEQATRPKNKGGRPRKIPLVEVQTPLSGIDQQSLDPTPKRKYCPKNNSPCGIDQQSQEPKPKSKYRFELNFLGGFKRASAGKKPLHKNKGGRPRKIPLSEVQTPSTLSEQPPQQIMKGNLLGESEEPTLKPKNKGGRPRKIPISEGIAPSYPSEQIQQQIIKDNLIGESEEQATRPKNKGGRPRKIPLSEVQTPSTLSEQPSQQIIKGNLLGESEEPATKPKNKGGRPRKIPLSEVIAPSTPSEQPSQQIIKGNLLGESEEPATRPKNKGGRPRKIPLSEVIAPSTPSEQIQQQIIKGNLLGESKEPATKPKNKGGRPRKIPLNKLEAPSTQAEQLEPQTVKESFLGESQEPTARPKNKGGRPRKIPLNKVEAPSIHTEQHQPQIVEGSFLRESGEPATRPKRKISCPKKLTTSSSGINQQSQELKPKRKYCRQTNFFYGTKRKTLSQDLKPKRKYCRKNNFPSGIGQQSQEPKPKRKYCRKTISLSGIKRNRLSQEIKPKRKYCRKSSSFSGIDQQSQEPKLKRKYCRKSSSLTGIKRNRLSQELKPKRKYCRKNSSLSGIDQQSQEPKPKRKYCRKNNSPCGIDQQSQEPKAKSKYRFELNYLGGFKRASAVKKPLHKNKWGRPRKIPFVEEIARPKNKGGRPRKILLSEVQAPSTPSEQLRQQSIKGNLLVECEEPTRPKNKGGRPRKIPLGEVEAPSTQTEQLQQQIIARCFLGESEEPAPRPRKGGRPKKLNTSVSGSRATLSATDQLELIHKIQVLIPGYVGPANDEDFVLEEFCSLESLEEAVQRTSMARTTRQGNRISRKRKNSNSLAHLSTTSAGNKRRAKRSSRSPEGSYWDCSVCTYRNKAEAFKCAMCDVRKGTSTRKPRLNAQLVAQQQAQQNLSPLIHVKTAKTTARSPAQRKAGTSKKPRPRLKNVDRSSAISTEVVVNNVPVIITEYKEKSHTRTSIDSDDASAERTNGNVNGL